MFVICMQEGYRFLCINFIFCHFSESIHHFSLETHKYIIPGFWLFSFLFCNSFICFSCLWSPPYFQIAKYWAEGIQSFIWAASSRLSASGTWSRGPGLGFWESVSFTEGLCLLTCCSNRTLSPAPSCLRSVSYLWSTQCQEEDFPDSSFCACYGHLSYGFWSQLFRVSIDFLIAIFQAFLTLSPGDPDWPHPTIVWHIGFVFVCQEIDWPGTHDPSTLTCMLCWDSRALVSRMCPAVPSPIFSWKRDFQWSCLLPSGIVLHRSHGQVFTLLAAISTSRLEFISQHWTAGPTEHWLPMVPSLLFLQG